MTLDEALELAIPSSGGYKYAIHDSYGGSYTCMDGHSDRSDVVFVTENYEVVHVNWYPEHNWRPFDW